MNHCIEEFLQARAIVKFDTSFLQCVYSAFRWISLISICAKIVNMEAKIIYFNARQLPHLQ